jgi:hypothetical protein
MKQFENNWKPDPNGLIRITYAAGSSHSSDIEQLKGVVNALNADNDVRGKFKIIIAGWDTEGKTTDITFNNEFAEELKKRKLLNKNILKEINKSRGDVNLIKSLPYDLKEKYKDKIFTQVQRDVNSDESIYFKYEKILTDNHNLITNKDYYNWLMNMERSGTYENEGFYGRRWTKKANMYATVLDETDIVIAPLADNEFNKFKSNLKQVEFINRLKSRLSNIDENLIKEAMPSIQYILSIQNTHNQLASSIDHMQQVFDIGLEGNRIILLR